METTSRHIPEDRWVFVFCVFYALSGLAGAGILALSNFRLVTAGILGALSLLTSYGLFRMKKWSVWLVMALFLPEMAFGITTLYFSSLMQSFFPTVEVLLFHLTLIAYLILVFISFFYLMTKKKKFK
jgi:uncharacterized membrane protein (DUF2068 family)